MSVPVNSIDGQPKNLLAPNAPEHSTTKCALGMSNRKLCSKEIFRIFCHQIGNYDLR